MVVTVSIDLSLIIYEIPCTMFVQLLYIFPYQNTDLQIIHVLLILLTYPISSLNSAVFEVPEDGTMTSQSNKGSNFEINNLFVQTEESFNSKIGHL